MLWIAVVAYLYFYIEVVYSATLSITPYPSASVEQYHSLTLTCSLSGSTHSILWNWVLNGYEVAVVTLNKNGECVKFSGVNNSSMYQFTCDLDRTKSTWTILNVTNSQHGDEWVCRTNTGDDSGATTVFVRVPVKAVYFSTPAGSLVNVTENAETVFMCQTTSARPRSTIQWYSATEGITEQIEGGQIQPIKNDSLSTTNSTLTYEFSRSYHEIYMYCTAVNIDGHDVRKSNEKQIIVHYPPGIPILKVGSHFLSGDLFVVRKDTVEVTCTSTSDPGPPSFQWTGQLSGNSLLKLINIQANTTKTCTATNTMYPTGRSPEIGSAQAVLTIVVMQQPTIPGLTYMSQQNGLKRVPLNTSTLVVIKGTSFSVYCSGSTSMPGPPSYRWSGSKTSNSDTISFTNIGVSYSGTYTCHVLNTMNRTYGDTVMGNNSNSVDVKIQYPPTVQHMEDLEIVENEELVLQCKASSCPVPSSFTWTRTRDNFSQHSSYLTILRARREDADAYTCTARNEMMPTVAEGATSGVNSKIVNVKILYPPDVTVTTVNGTIKDEYVDIHCTAVGVPSSYTFSMWRQTWPGSFAVVRDQLASINTSRPSGRTLRLTNLSYQDTGVYTCGVSNGVNSRIMTGSSFLLVKSEPVLANTSKAFKILATFNTQFMITMAVYSNDGNITAKMMSNYTDGDVNASISIVDEPALKLQVYGREISTDGYSLIVSRFINRREDFGYYSIYITNNFGTIVVPLEVVAEGRPCSPNNVSIAKSTTNSVTLSWFRCFHGGREQTFVIQHSMNGLKWINSSLVEGGLSTSQHSLNSTIRSLLPNRLYYFKLFAYNDLGRSDFTSVLNSTTMANADEFLSEPNTGLIAGGAVGGLIPIAIVIVIVFLLFHRHKKSQVSRHKQQSDAAMDYKNGHEYVNMAASSDATVCDAAPEQSSEDSRFAASEYDLLDSETTNKHIYTGLEVEVKTKLSKEEAAKQRMNDNTRRMRPKDGIDKAPEQNLGQKVAEPEAVYSNLMIRNA